MEDDSLMSNNDSEEKLRIETTKIIQDPRSCIVQNQIHNTDSVKMLKIYPNRDQRLITFDMSKKDCTAQDLLVEEKKRPLELEEDELGPLKKMRGDIRLTAGARFRKEPESLTLPSHEKDQGEAKLKKFKMQNSNSTLADVGYTDDHIITESVLEEGSESIITNIGSVSTIMEHDNSNKEGIKGRDVLCEIQFGGCDYLIEAACTTLSGKLVVIGSHFYEPEDKVIISKSGVRLRAPLVKDRMNFVLLEIKIDDIKKMIIWVRQDRLLLFLYMTPNAVDTIDKSLGLQDSNERYFDSAGKESSSPHITLLLEELTKQSIAVLETLFAPSKFLRKVTHLGTIWTLERTSHKNTGPQIKSLTQRSEETISIVDDTVVDDQTKMLFKKSQSLIQKSEQITPTLNNTEDRGIMCEVRNMAYRNTTIQAPYTSLICRSVRIGSYKYILEEAVILSQSGITLGVPLCGDGKIDTVFIPLLIKLKAIIKVLIHFGEAMPVLFINIKMSTADILRKLLGMCDSKGPYYDPSSNDITQKWITLVPEKMSAKAKLFLKNLFSSDDLLKELSSEEAKSILARTSPKNGSLPHDLFENQGKLDVVKTEVKIVDEQNSENKNQASISDCMESDGNMETMSELPSSSSTEKSQTIAAADTETSSDRFWNVWMVHT